MADERLADVIDVFADISCPFAHVQLHQLVTRRAHLGLDVPLRVRAWPLELVNGSPTDPGLVAEEVEVLREQVDASLFSAFDRTCLPSSTLPALDLAEAAYRRSDDVGEQVSLALRRALFTEGRDVSDPTVLRDIAHRFDLDGDGTELRSAVLAEWKAGEARGVKGSPHVFCGGSDWFSPGLEIDKDGDDIVGASAKDADVDRLLRECVGGGDG